MYASAFLVFCVFYCNSKYCTYVHYPQSALRYWKYSSPIVVFVASLCCREEPGK